jgi:hypothetical protein
VIHDGERPQLVRSTCVLKTGRSRVLQLRARHMVLRHPAQFLTSSKPTAHGRRVSVSTSFHSPFL